MESVIIMLMGLIALVSISYSKIWDGWLRLRSRLLLNRSEGIFDNDYLNGKSFYLYRFGKIPNISFIDDIDVQRAFSYVMDQFGENVEDTYQRNSFDKDTQKLGFEKTVFVLKNKVVIVLNYQYATIYFMANAGNMVDDLISTFHQFRLPEKKVDFEINIITSGQYGLELKAMPIRETTLDIDLFYNNDFKNVDRVIKERLAKANDKGIVLLHGLPGTGKTTYLRHLVGSLKKKVLFVSPSVAGNLMNPDFIDLLIDNPNCVLVIEDAENIMMDRKFNSDSSVSNLLNISDGLLSDCLNVQVVCTFNSDLNLIDPALMRKGRLIARYEFGKLAVSKAQTLSRKLGFDSSITNAMTLAEIANQHEIVESARKVEIMGFRRQTAEATGMN